MERIAIAASATTLVIAARTTTTLLVYRSLDGGVTLAQVDSTAVTGTVLGVQRRRGRWRRRRRRQGRRLRQGP